MVCLANFEFPLRMAAKLKVAAAGTRRAVVVVVLCVLLASCCLGWPLAGQHRRLGCVSSAVQSTLWARKKKTERRDDEDVEYVTEDTLKSLWAGSGRDAKSFDESAAMMEYIRLQGIEEDKADGEDVEDYDEGAVDFFSMARDRDPDGASNMEVENALFEDASEKAPTRAKRAKAAPLQQPVPIAVPNDVDGSTKLVGRSVGIDLGTTYSSVSVIEGGIPVIIPMDGARIVRSVVGYLPEGGVLVGDAAKRQTLLNPANTYASIKRIIGRTHKQLKESGDDLDVLKVVRAGRGGSGGAAVAAEGSSAKAKAKAKAKAAGSENQVEVLSPLLKRNLSPEEISAQVLGALLRTAEGYLGERVTRAVVTVPAYFSPSQCDATERAGRLAGLDKVRLLREPEAAALAYGLTQKQRQIVLVFDLGGGTFDVSVLEVGGGFVEVIATSGDSHLGGDDFDRVIVNWLLDEHVRLGAGLGAEEYRRLQKNQVVMTRLLEAAESAKIALSERDNSQVEISVPLLFPMGGGGGGGTRLSNGEAYSIQTVLTRKRFESLTKPLIARLLKPLREVAIMSGINLPGESGQLGINEGAFAEDDDGDDDADAAGEGRGRGGVGYLGEGGDVNGGALSPAQLKLDQLRGKAKAKARKKIKGSTSRELRRLQKELGDPSLTIFPGGQQLDGVVMVGGSTRIPAVQRLVRVITGISPVVGGIGGAVNPDEAVSLGAAIMGGILDGTVTNMNVMSAFQSAIYRAFYDAKGVKVTPEITNEDEEGDEDEDEEEEEEEEEGDEDEEGDEEEEEEEGDEDEGEILLEPPPVSAAANERNRRLAGKKETGVRKVSSILLRRARAVSLKGPKG